MDAFRKVHTVSANSPQRPLRSGYAKALLSMQPGDSFTIPNDERLRGRVRTAAHYWRIPITGRIVSPNEIRIWRVEDKPIDPRPIAVNSEVPPPAKLTSAAEIALLREAKAKILRQNAGERKQEVELVNNERHTVTLVIVEKKAAAGPSK